MFNVATMYLFLTLHSVISLDSLKLAMGESRHTTDLGNYVNQGVQSTNCPQLLCIFIYFPTYTWVWVSFPVLLMGIFPGLRYTIYTDQYIFSSILESDLCKSSAVLIWSLCSSLLSGAILYQMGTLATLYSLLRLFNLGRLVSFAWDHPSSSARISSSSKLGQLKALLLFCIVWLSMSEKDFHILCPVF